jgi:uncharacterized protein
MAVAMTTETSKSKGPRCPICKTEAVALYVPFCSKRCADIDLGKWFKNSYAIPGTVADDETESALNPVSDAEDDSR